MVMKVIYLKAQESIFQLEPSVIAIGYFDGLHLGHMQLLHQVEQIAATTGLKKGFMTFDQHPQVVFGKKDFQYLMSLQQKISLIENMGFDYFFIIEFNQSVAQKQPLEFINSYLIKNRIEYVVCGFDFHFGDHGKGDSQTLKELSQNRYQVKVISKYEIDHQKVSSSLIRHYIHEGQISKANQLLNRPYRITGKVMHGLKNGRRIGFPTANVDVGQYVVLKRGVYGAYVYIHHKRYKAMANIGLNPTVGVLNTISLEVHIFDFDEDIYGLSIDVDFIEYTREEIQFKNLDELSSQLNSDKRYIDQLLD